jgi:hypothetical protein
VLPPVHDTFLCHPSSPTAETCLGFAFFCFIQFSPSARAVLIWHCVCTSLMIDEDQHLSTGFLRQLDAIFGKHLFILVPYFSIGLLVFLIDLVLLAFSI